MQTSNLKEKAKNIKAVTFDGDGVLFTGRVFFDSKGEKLKERSFVDGQGISLLRASGIRIAFVTAEKSGFIEELGKKLNTLPSVQNGNWPPVSVFTGLMGDGKIDAINSWLKEAGIEWSECAHMGDDLSDYEILKKVGLPAAPAQAESVIKDVCVYVADRRGGDGAIRDLANFILEEKEVDIISLARR